VDDKSLQPHEGVSSAPSVPAAATGQTEKTLGEAGEAFSKPRGRLGPRQAMWRITCCPPVVTPPKLHPVKSKNSRS
jgi:hypothetical protein